MFILFVLISTENPVLLRRTPFLFGLRLFPDRKKVTPRNPASGAIILSNATDQYRDLKPPQCLLRASTLYSTCYNYKITVKD